ncbi:DNA-directed RNA polymerase subunit beta' [Geodia barretti]|uniref:DNA-directed RNA polymerase subunit n=1 Tax=Geodia barretti TaxID=519541 RepID=A0AA35WAS9_GEOBA|nr:DNA-directed RNA polymerase subunit beta' [Geodia barretti]
MADRTETTATDFNAIRISIASPEQILSWSHGEVTKPETINYRTLRPEKDGLFCERLFGPTKDWECFCGKYKRIRYRGVVCDRCGVEVTRAKVRRERMGHIRLAAPVAHIWFSKTNPSRLGLLLDLSPRNLERVLYFAQHIVVSVDEDLRKETIEAEQLKHELEVERRRSNAADELEELNRLVLSYTGGVEPETKDPATEFAPEGGAPVAELLELQRQIDAINNQLSTELSDLAAQLKVTLDELNDLQKMKLLAESRYRELKDRYPGTFEAGMGAEAILAILRAVNLETLRDQLINDMQSTSGQRRQKAIKRLRVVEAFRQSGSRSDGSSSDGTRVEDMILTVMPVLPPELRPMVQLDGGRFATSDLNDLYRRVINRNNRLKRLMTLGAPEIIIRNEKRMLQEAVDALIDNGRRGRPIQGSHNHKLKSLSDLLRGKQGRFRQNLLGKRVDYSGRSVIVVGPELKMNECGLPRRMALELFKPFVMHRLVMLGIAPNIKNAKRMVERARGEVWDILEDVIKNRPVLLNRAPTLHRLGIQAFMPVLIDGHAIQIHPLVCSAFNADFDGDQMAVHVPLSRMAVLEAQEAMLSTHNMLSPASGDPLVAPTLDMVMGCYYLTDIDTPEKRPDVKGAGRQFQDISEARDAYGSSEIDLRAPIYVRRIRGGENPGGYYSTTLGRLEFNSILPDKFVFDENLPEAARIQNKLIDRSALNALTANLYRLLTNDETAEVLDRIKDLGFRYATTSGITIAINDIQVSPEKAQVMADTEERVDQYKTEYEVGLISEEERHAKIVDAWNQASFETADLVGSDLTNYGGIGIMALSGTKGNISQINQMAGMRGLVRRAGSTDVIELPVKSNFREGLTRPRILPVHARRPQGLIDVAQEVIVQGEDCGTLDGWAPQRPAPHSNITLQYRVTGRLAAYTLAHPETGEILINRNETITLDKANQLVAAGITEIPIRSPLTCEAHRGVCRMCYGDLAATDQPVLEGQAVGIIAAQSIGEPGTQLTMRVFHTGGVRRRNSELDEAVLTRARELQAVPVEIREQLAQFRRDMPSTIATRMTEALGYLEQTNEARNQRGQINWIRDDLSRLGEINSLSQARDLVSQIRRDVDVLNAGIDSQLGSAGQRRDQRRDTMNRLRLMARELPDQIDLILEEVRQIPAADLQEAVTRVRVDATAVVPELRKVIDEITRMIEEIPGADARLQGRLLVVIERILDELRRSSEAKELEEAVGRVVQAGTSDDDYFRVASELNRILGSSNRHSYDLQREADVIRQDVEAQNLDITGGLPQVEEIFEARVPKSAAILSDIDGEVEVETDEENNVLRVVFREEVREEFPLPEGARILVGDGDMVDAGDVLADVPAVEQYVLPEGAEVLVDDGEEVTEGMVLASLPETQDAEEAAQVPTARAGGRVEVSEHGLAVISDGGSVEATVGGRVELSDEYITVIWEDMEIREHVIPTSAYLMVRDGDKINAGDPLTSGPLNPHDILRIRGKEALQSYIVDQVQAVYQSQGVTIHDKHIEIILRQMLRRVQVTEPGDTELIPGEVADKFAFQEQVAKVLAEGGEPATAEQVLLGITRASLRTDSFLSAASFQETTRVLTEAAVKGQQDYLLGLKENVIIGRLIPAQVEIPGMEELLRPQTGAGHGRDGPKHLASRPGSFRGTRR